MDARRLAAIDLNLLVALEALLDEQHVTRAAAKVGVTQSAMSRSLGRLRDLFGDELLIRTSEGMRASRKAIDLRAPLEEALESLRGVLGAVDFEPASSGPAFRLALSDYAEQVISVPLVQAAAARGLGRRLDLVSLDSGSSVRDLVDGKVDVSITILKDVPELRSTPLLHDQFVSVMRRGHPLTSNAGLDLEAFAAAGHVVACPRAPGAGWVDDLLSAVGRQRQVVLTTPRFSTVLQIVAASDLVATVPRRALTPRDEASVVSFPPPIDMPALTLNLCWAQRLEHQPSHRWLRQLIVSLGDGQL